MNDRSERLEWRKTKVAILRYLATHPGEHDFQEIAHHIWGCNAPTYFIRAFLDEISEQLKSSRHDLMLEYSEDTAWVRRKFQVKIYLTVQEQKLLDYIHQYPGFASVKVLLAQIWQDPIYKKSKGVKVVACIGSINLKYVNGGLEKPILFRWKTGYYFNPQSIYQKGEI